MNTMSTDGSGQGATDAEGEPVRTINPTFDNDDEWKGNEPDRGGGSTSPRGGGTFEDATEDGWTKGLATADARGNALGGANESRGPPPRKELLAMCSVGCLPCVGWMALQSAKDVAVLWNQDEIPGAINAQKKANHLGFVSVVFGTLIWMVVFGLLIKPAIESEPPCDNFPVSAHAVPTT